MRGVNLESPRWREEFEAAVAAPDTSQGEGYRAGDAGIAPAQASIGRPLARPAEPDVPWVEVWSARVVVWGLLAAWVYFIAHLVAWAFRVFW